MQYYGDEGWWKMYTKISIFKALRVSFYKDLFFWKCGDKLVSKKTFFSENTLWLKIVEDPILIQGEKPVRMPFLVEELPPRI